MNRDYYPANQQAPSPSSHGNIYPPPAVAQPQMPFSDPFQSSRDPFLPGGGGGSRRSSLGLSSRSWPQNQGTWDKSHFCDACKACNAPGAGCKNNITIPEHGSSSVEPDTAMRWPCTLLESSQQSTFWWELSASQTNLLCHMSPDRRFGDEPKRGGPLPRPERSAMQRSSTCDSSSL